MSKQPDKIDPKQTFAPFDISVLALGGQVGCTTLVIVIFSVFGGLWLDSVFDTKPIFTIFFILGSAPLALILTYWMAMRTIRNKRFASPDNNDKQTTKEEFSSE